MNPLAWLALVVAIIAGVLSLHHPVPPNVPPVPQARPKPPEALRLLSYNIRHGEGSDGRFDLERTAAQIAAIAPDIAVLQEVDSNWVRSNGFDEPDVLSKEAELPYRYFATPLSYPAGDPHAAKAGAPALYGVLLLSRYPITQARTQMLYRRDDNEPRALLIATIQTPAGPLQVLGTHLSTHGDERYQQALEVRALSEQAPQRRVLMGDFNDAPGSATLTALTGVSGGLPTWYDAAALLQKEPLTFPADAPHKRIDFVLVSRDLARQIEDVSVLPSTASDHRPILVDLVWTAGS